MLPPYQYAFDSTPLSPGEHTLTAVAYDAYGHSTSTTAKFSSAGILLDSDYVLLAALDTHDFSATANAGVDLPLVWSVDEGRICGSVSPEGEYKAPNGTGFCHVRATSPSDARSTVVATVRVYSADLNGDGVVDGEDMGLLAQAYGASDSDATYNEDADLDASFSVDDSDVTLFVSQFGR